MTVKFTAVCSSRSLAFRMDGSEIYHPVLLPEPVISSLLDDKPEISFTLSSPGADQSDQFDKYQKAKVVNDKNNVVFTHEVFAMMQEVMLKEVNDYMHLGADNSAGEMMMGMSLLPLKTMSRENVKNTAGPH